MTVAVLPRAKHKDGCFYYERFGCPKASDGHPRRGRRTHLKQYVWLAAVGVQDRHCHAVALAVRPLQPLLDAAHRMHEREGVGCHDLPILQGPHMNAVRLCTAARLQLKQCNALQAWIKHLRGKHQHIGKAIRMQWYLELQVPSYLHGS